MNRNWSTGTTWWRSMPANSRKRIVADRSANRPIVWVVNPDDKRVAEKQPQLSRCLYLKCLYLGVQAAFVSRGLVLVHQTFSSHAVQNRNRCGVSFRSSRFVATANSRHNTLHMSTHHRAHTSVAGTSVFCLTSTFFRLGGVRQVVLLGKVKEKSEIQPNSIVRALSVVNQCGRYSSIFSRVKLARDTKPADNIELLPARRIPTAKPDSNPRRASWNPAT